MSSPPRSEHLSPSTRPSGQQRRRGRRPAGQDTRAALLAAARAEFAERGYQGARVRSIATAAGVDAAMVNHWFGGKEGLFVAALDLPLTPEIVFSKVLDGDPERIGERLVRTFVTTWDTAGGQVFAALLRSVANHEEATRMIREFVLELLFRKLTTIMAPDQQHLRAGLCASQIVGLGMARYVIALDPVASADADTLAAMIGPNLQRYLTGPLP